MLETCCRDSNSRGFRVNDHNTTQWLFPGFSLKPIVAQFDQQHGSSDGGTLLLKAADRRHGLIAGLAASLRDERQAGKIDHTLVELLAQRVFAIACGYPDANDGPISADEITHTPALLLRTSSGSQSFQAKPRTSEHPIVDIASCGYRARAHPKQPEHASR